MRYTSVAAFALTVCLSIQARASSYQYQSFLSLPGAPTSYTVTPAAIDDRGDEIVGTVEPESTEPKGFVFDGGKTRFVSVPGATFGTMLTGVNRAGSVAGYASSKQFLVSFIDAKGVRYPVFLPDGAPVRAMSINNQSQIAALASIHGEFVGAILHLGAGMAVDRARLFAVPGSRETSPSSINDQGQVVGTYFDSVGAHGFLCVDGLFATINAPGAGPVGTFVNGINNHGDIVGRYVDATQGNHGFLLRHGKYTAIGFPGSEGATSATAISNRGVIVGNYGVVGSQGGSMIAGFIATPQP